MCSALPTTLLPNAGCVMDTWSTCPCRRPIQTERPIDVSVPTDIGTKHDCLESSNIEVQLGQHSRTWRLVTGPHGHGRHDRNVFRQRGSEMHRSSVTIASTAHGSFNAVDRG